MKKLLLSAILLISTSISSLAADIPSTGAYNLRSMSLGNTTFISNSGANALFTNPALLGLNEKGHFTIIGISDGVNDEGKDVQKTIMDMMDDALNDTPLSIGDPSIDGKTFNELSDVEKLKYVKFRQGQTKGKSLSRFTNLPMFAYAGKHFGTGIFLSEYISDGQITGQVAPKVILKGNMKMEVPIGLQFDFGEEKNIHTGLSLRYINFLKFDTDISAFDLMEFDDQNLDILGITLNHGFALNLGGAYTFTDYNTTVGLSIQDLWSTINSYNLPSTDDLEPGTLLTGGSDKIGSGKFMPNMRLGVNTKPFEWLEVGAELDNLMSKNLDGISDTRDNNLFKKMHFGTEFSPLKLTPLKDSWLLDLKLRAGVNQGYLTYGAGLKLFVFDLEYAHFIEETGYTVGMDPNPVDAVGIALKF